MGGEFYDKGIHALPERAAREDRRLILQAIHARKLIKPIEQTYTEMFSGKVYTVGKGAVSVRSHSSEADHTVIAVHGFLENHCYFTQSYQNSLLVCVF